MYDQRELQLNTRPFRQEQYFEGNNTRQINKHESFSGAPEAMSTEEIKFKHPESEIPYFLAYDSGPRAGGRQVALMDGLSGAPLGRGRERGIFFESKKNEFFKWMRSPGREP